MSDRPSLSVVMIFKNAGRFIEEALASLLAQTFEDWELILVDDGSTDASTTTARTFTADHADRVRYLEHEAHQNHGMSVSRNLGVRAARGTLVAFLDADDVWREDKLASQVAIMRAEPDATMVFGAPLYWHSWSGTSEHGGGDHTCPAGATLDTLVDGADFLVQMAPLGSGAVPCPSDLMVRKDIIEAVNGFEPRFTGAFEDVAFLVKTLPLGPVFVSSASWTLYRIHDRSCMAVSHREGQYESTRVSLLNWYEEYLVAKGQQDGAAWTRVQAALRPYRSPLAELGGCVRAGTRRLQASPNPVPPDSSDTMLQWSTDNGAVGQVWVSQDGASEVLFAEGASGASAASWIRPGSSYEFSLYGGTARARLIERLRVGRLVDPGVGRESFGSLRRTVPFSRQFGFDRGVPIDRYYIEAFLRECRSDIRGVVLEVGERTYSTRFGSSAIESIETLSISPEDRGMTFVADLADWAEAPSARFDSVVLLQTLHLIFEVREAVRTLHGLLKPGGVLLATFPGLSPRSSDRWGDSWYWGFTSRSARRVFESVFDPANISVRTFGNVLSATAFLYGLAASELTTDELDQTDACYETLIAVRVVK